MDAFILTLDVETLPGQTEEARAIARAETKAPGNLKKAESIEAWWAEQGDAAVMETWRRQALDPATGELCAIGFATGEEGEPDCFVRAVDEPEGAFLRRALRAVQETTIQDMRRPFIVGHNVQFDLQFLRARCWANRIAPPVWLPRPDARLGRDYGDTMTQFAGYGGRISLSKLCRCLGLSDPKADSDGCDVPDLWQRGCYAAIAEYCKGDVAATRQAWLIMAGLERLEVVE